MNAVGITDGLLNWSQRAGYAMTDDESGATVFWSNPGGELRYYIRHAESGWTVLTFASRGSDQQFELTTASVSILERYLYSLFGADIRQRLGLRRLKIGTTREWLATSCTLSEMADDGYRTLDCRGEVVARATDPVSSVSKLTKLSQLMTATIEDIEASFLSEDGAPLFRV
jgi:Immunity protein 61